LRASSPRESLHEFKLLPAWRTETVNGESAPDQQLSAATGNADIMKAPGHMGVDVEAGLRPESWGTDASPAGDEQLEQLFALLDRPWFCRRHNVLFEMRERGQQRVIHIIKGGMLAATWTAEGHALVLRPAGEGPQERAGTLDCAISLTCDFLDHARIKPPKSAAQLAGAH